VIYKNYIKDTFNLISDEWNFHTKAKGNICFDGNSNLNSSFVVLESLCASPRVCTSLAATTERNLM